MSNVMLEGAYPPDYHKKIRGDYNTQKANIVIKQLNGELTRGQTYIPRFSVQPLSVKVLSLVAKAFKLSGWKGVQQRKTEDNFYTIELIAPECTCTGAEECDKCKEGPY